MIRKIIGSAALVGSFFLVQAQQRGRPQDTEVWEPIPKTVNTAKPFADAPSDAIVLFDGKSLDKWVSTQNREQAAAWTVANNTFTVKKGAGNIETKQTFTNYQLHIEWLVPEGITGEAQGRGNSGVFLASTGKGDAGYELQILDSYNNKTYVNGMAGSIYKQFTPLANPAKKPGEWQTYDIVWMAPVFNADSTLKTPARVTVFFNGVLVNNSIDLVGATQYIGKPSYKQHGATPIKLQAHGDRSEPLSFRNIWLRELPN